MTPTDTTTPPADPEPVEPDDDSTDDVEEEAAAIDLEENGRKWLRAISELVTAAYGPVPTVSDGRVRELDRRVQFGLDMMMIAACERATRVLHSDLIEE